MVKLNYKWIVYTFFFLSKIVLDVKIQAERRCIYENGLHKIFTVCLRNKQKNNRQVALTRSAEEKNDDE